MSRPRKIASDQTITEPIKREKRPDPLPFKVYFKHFAANLSLGCVRTPDGVSKVYLYDTATYNYSDVTELAEIAAVARKIFRGKSSQPFIIAAFMSPVHAQTFMETWLDNIHQVELDAKLDTVLSEEQPNS